jgi:hypothetical protein
MFHGYVFFVTSQNFFLSARFFRINRNCRVAPLPATGAPGRLQEACVLHRRNEATLNI